MICVLLSSREIKNLSQGKHLYSLVPVLCSTIQSCYLHFKKVFAFLPCSDACVKTGAPTRFEAFHFLRLLGPAQQGVQSISHSPQHQRGLVSEWTLLTERLLHRLATASGSALVVDIMIVVILKFWALFVKLGCCHILGPYLGLSLSLVLLTLFLWPEILPIYTACHNPPHSLWLCWKTAPHEDFGIHCHDKAEKQTNNHIGIANYSKHRSL